MQDEAAATCPWCWEQITLLLDLSVPEQDYIEDCPVCCHPMRITVMAEAGEVLALEVERSDG